MEKFGVVHGRFQILHNDHVKYILAGKQQCHILIIGITNPDPTLTESDDANPSRSLSSFNPLSYFERYLMIKAAMVENDLGYSEFCITPFPINFPDLYKYYVPTDAVFYITIYDDWGRRKKELLTKTGLRTEVLWDRAPDQKGLTGSYIRSLMVNGGNWENFVPKSVAALINEWGIAARLRSMQQG